MIDGTYSFLGLQSAEGANPKGLGGLGRSEGLRQPKFNLQRTTAIRDISALLVWTSRHC